MLVDPTPKVSLRRTERVGDRVVPEEDRPR